MPEDTFGLEEGSPVFDLGDSFYSPDSWNFSDVTLDPGDGTSYSSVAKAAILSGIRDIPVAGTIFERLLTTTFGIDRERLEEMAYTANSTPFGKGLRFAASLGGEMLLTGGAYALGRRLLVRGLQAAVPQAMAHFAAPGPLGQGIPGATALKTSLGRVAARTMDAPGGTDALRALGITAPVPKPVIERGAEILGGAIGVGNVYALDALMEGKGPREALHAGLYTAALSAGIESAFTAGAKAIFPSAREIDINRLLAKTEGSWRYQHVASSNLHKLSRTLQVLHDTLIDLHNVPGPNLQKIARVEQTIAQKSNELSALTLFTDMDPLFRVYFRESPRERAGFVQNFISRFAKTPEQMAGELGPAAAKVVELAKRAQATTTMARSYNNVELREVDKLARRGQGVVWRGKHGEYLLDPLDAWQRTGDATTLTTKDPESLNKAFKILGDLIDQAEFHMVELGIQPPRHYEAIPIARKFRDFPLVLDRLDPTADLLGKVGRVKSEEQLTEELARALKKVGYNSVDAGAAARKVVFGDAHRTPIFGTTQRNVWSMFDETSLNSLFEGKTFKEVVELGAPILKDPIMAVEAYLNSVARRIAYTKAFGKNGQLAYGPMRQAAIAQGASIQLYDNVVEAILGQSYGTVAEQAAAAAIVNTQTGTRMGLGVIPNFFQFINTGLLTGVGAMVKGLFSMYRKGPVRAAAEASAINDSLIRGWRETFLDPFTRTPAGRFSDMVLLSTGFSWRERWNRTHAFHSTAIRVSKDLVRAVEGRLRGNTLDIARRRFQSIGYSLDDLVRMARNQPGSTSAEKVENLLLGLPDKNGHRNADLLKELAIGGVRLVQFLPDKTRLPPFWATPWGRVLLQFKSFALNQTRLLRDQVIGEAAKGDLGPLLYMMSSFPIAGEMVIAAKQTILEGRRRRTSNSLQRLVEDIAAVGGFGLAGDLYRAAAWGPEQIYRSLVGPTAEDIAYGLNAIVNKDFDRIVERANKLPTYRAALTIGTVGLGLAMEGQMQIKSALEYYLGPPAEEELNFEGDFEDVEEGEGESPPTLQELLQRFRR